MDENSSNCVEKENIMDEMEESDMNSKRPSDGN